MRYRQEIDREWFKPRMENWYMRCCDCGLVHKIDFKMEDGELWMRAEQIKGKRHNKTYQ
jgi:uncharacterized Zn finger protein